MNQRYQFFILHWKRYLSDYENIFSSVNIYSIIKYLKEYWNSNRGRDLTSFEKHLVDRLVVIIENQGPDIKIIEKLDTDITELLGKETKSLKQKKKLDDNTIKIIDHVISYCHSEQFKREMFNRIFDSSENESEYLIQCILRILIEEHSKNFLEEVPTEVFVKYLLNKHTPDIINLLKQDFVNDKTIFNYLLEFMKENFIFKIKDVDSFKSESINGKWSFQLKIRIGLVIDFVREQLKYNNNLIITNNNEKIIMDTNFQNFARRVEKYFYHQCFVYLINLFDVTRHKTYSQLHKFLSENYPSQFSNFFVRYNEDMGLTYDKFSSLVFSADMLCKIFFGLLIIVSKFCSFKISNFPYKLKSTMDSFGKVKLSESMYLNSFVDTLRDFFFQQFDNNFLMFMDIIRNTDLNRISNIQIRNAAIHLFLKELPDYMKKNHKDFCSSSFSNLDDIGQFFCSILLYGKKKYRVFFSLKGIGSDETKIDLGQVKIYNEKWNFHESLSFDETFKEKLEPLDKYKFKICCDVPSNNRYDALVIAKQRCFDTLSSISFTYNSPSNIRPYFEKYYDITEIPPKKGHMTHDIAWPIELKKELLDNLTELSRKLASNIFLQRSLTWLREGYYAITEYSEFLFYWLGLETIMGILGTSNKPMYIYNFIAISTLVNQNQQYSNRFIDELGLVREEGDSITHILKKIFELDIHKINENLLNFLEENPDKLNYIFLKRFTITYIYRKRNSLVHEGESFSFEVMGLSKVLEKYAIETIQLIAQGW